MNKRIISIINRILNNEKVTLKNLANEFEVTERTIRYDIEKINSILENEVASPLILESGGNISYSNDFSAIKELLYGNGFYLYKLSKNERIMFSSYFIVKNNFTLVKELEEKLCVSRSTIIKEIKEIREYLKGYDLELISSNNGFNAEGKEENKRRLLLVVLAYSYCNLGDVVKIYNLLDIKNDSRLLVQEIISKVEADKNCFLSDKYYNELVLYIDILISRSQSSFYPEKDAIDDVEKDEFLLATISEVSKIVKIQSVSDELNVLQNIIGKPKYIKNSAYREKNILKVQFLTRQFIEEVSKDIEMDLTKDVNLFNNLSNHISSIVRTCYTLYPENEIVKQVKSEYKNILEIVRKHIFIYNNNVNKNFSEIDTLYITIHICAAIERMKNDMKSFKPNVVMVCNSGVATSQLLIAKLKNFFDLNIIDIVSSRNLEKIDFEEVDFIITTTPLANLDKDYVLITQLLGDEDYLKLFALIEQKKVERMQGDLKSKKEDKEVKHIHKTPDMFAINTTSKYHLDNILPVENIKLNVSAQDWQEAVVKSANILYEKNYIEKSYIDEIIRIIKENGPYMVIDEGVILAHAGIDSGSLKIGLSMIRLNEGVNFGSPHFDPVDFIFTLSAVDNLSHVDALLNFYNIIKKTDARQKMRLAKKPEEILEILTSFEI